MGKVIRFRQHGINRVDTVPISAMNMTPLIDVLLVLLVILIITLPATLHEIDVPLPTPGRVVSDKEPIVQTLLLNSGGVALWNGKAVDQATLAERLRATAKAGDELQFQTEANTRYAHFSHTIALVRKSGVTNIGFVGNDAFAKWDK